jgi:hypothetical protein
MTPDTVTSLCTISGDLFFYFVPLKVDRLHKLCNQTKQDSAILHHNLLPTNNILTAFNLIHCLRDGVN